MSDKYIVSGGFVYDSSAERSIDLFLTARKLNELTAKVEALEGELKNTQDAMDAYARAFFRLSDAAEKCKETANEAQFRSLKEYYFAALQEIESVLDAALDIS